MCLKSHISAHTITLSLDREEFALRKQTLREKARVSTTATLPTSIVIKRDLEFFLVSCKKYVVHKKGASVETSASFSCPQTGCSLSFFEF